MSEWTGEDRYLGWTTADWMQVIGIIARAELKRRLTTIDNLCEVPCEAFATPNTTPATAGDEDKRKI